MHSDEQWVVEQKMRQATEQEQREGLRVRRYLIGVRQLIYSLSCKRTAYDCIEIAECDLPEGYKIVGVSISHLWMVPVVYVEHPSFDPIPFCQEIPTHRSEVPHVIVRLKEDPTEDHCYLVEEKRKS